jgi:small-conductance mechanosensitive channel
MLESFARFALGQVGAVILQEPADVPEVETRLQTVYDQLAERFYELVAYLPLILVAALVVLAFWWLARVIGRRERLYQRLSANRFVQDLLRQVVKGAVLLTGVLLALEILQATALVGAVLGAAGVAGIAIGFAFKDLVENYVASILLSLRHPFGPGDHVVIGSHEGKVIRLTSRATILITLDGNHLRIPNADVFKGTILNYSTNPLRRFQFSVGVGVEEGLSRVREIALGVLDEMEGVIDDPEPTVLIEQLGDSTVNLVCRGWVDQRAVDFNKVRSEAIRLVKERFDDQGISMPEPTYRVQMLEQGAAEPTVEHAPEPLITGDISVERHLDEQIAVERAGEEDLLDEGHVTE